MKLDLKNVWDSFPPAVAMWARHMIQLEITDTVETAGVLLTADGYHMAVNPDFVKSNAQLHTLLLHELAHVFRGDCLREVKDEDKELMNFAADCLINHNLDHEVVQEMKGCQYVPVAKELNLPENYLVSTDTLFKAMKKNKKDGKGMCDGFGREGGKEECETAHADTVISARGEILDAIEKQIGKKVDSYSVLAGLGDSSRTKVKAPEPLPLALPGQILKKLRSFRGASQRTRSWKRPGRVDLLRGSCFEPRYNLLVSIDVSGSCVPYWGQLGGTAAYLKARHCLDLSIFDTKAYKTKSLTDLAVFGGGTCIQPVFDLFNQGKYDALIVLTDGELFDWPGVDKLPNAPIIWIIPGGNLHTVKLRDGDALISI